MLALVAAASAVQAADVLRTPREAIKDAADRISTSVPPSIPVFAYMRDPQDLEFYLGRPVQRAQSP